MGLPKAPDEILESRARIMARCVSPNKWEDGQETGLVVGYVQSGKTLSFTTVAALHPTMVSSSNSTVGTKKNLYSQTGSVFGEIWILSILTAMGHH